MAIIGNPLIYSKAYGFAAAHNVEKFTATAGQTVFNLANAYMIGVNALQVYINGARQAPTAYTETSTTSITFSEALVLDDEVVIEIIALAGGLTVTGANTTFTPVGGIAATNVQAAIAELDAEKLSHADILGIVSQSGGVPTGAIIETGSNANGDYTKFANGLMICTYSAIVTDQACSTSYAPIYFGDRSWTFPHAFVGIPITSTPLFKWGTGASWGGTAGGTSTTSALRIYDITPRATGTSTLLNAIAIGRWF